jgi:hypothetical protein
VAILSLTEDITETQRIQQLIADCQALGLSNI